MRVNRQSIPTVPNSRGRQPGATALSVGRIVYVGLILVVVALGGALLLRQADDIAALKYEVRVLVNRQESLRRVRTGLEGQIAALESLQRVRELGEAWGFERPAADQEIELTYTVPEGRRVQER